MRPIKNKVLRNALWLAIQWNESLIDSYRTEFQKVPDAYLLPMVVPTEWRKNVGKLKQENEQFKKLLGIEANHD